MTKPLNFVTLVGSLRKKSCHAAIARALPELAPEGVTITALGSVADLPHYDTDLHADGFPEAVLEMGKAIKEADGIIIVTPEYNYSIPGALKNAIDWVSRLPDTPFAGKPVALQTGSPGMIAGSRAQYHLRQVMVFLDALVLNKPEVMISQMWNKVDSETDTLNDEETRQFISTQLSAFKDFALKIQS